MRFRAPAEFNMIIRKLANAEGIHLADIEHVFRSQTKHGILGLNLFWDHVHPNTRGKYLLAREVAKTLIHNDCLGLGQPVSPPLDQVACVENAGYTPIDDMNALDKMIVFHRFYPMKNILNCSEIIEKFSGDKQNLFDRLDESYRQALQIQMNDRETMLPAIQNNPLQEGHPKPYSHLKIAAHLFEKGFYKEADQEYRAVIRSYTQYHPELPNLYTRQVLCLNQRSDLNKQEKMQRLAELFRECRPKFSAFTKPGGANRLHEIDNMALLAFWAEDYAFAIPLLEESARSSPREFTLEQLVRTYTLSGKSEQAKAVAQKLLALAPGNQLAIQTLGDMDPLGFKPNGKSNP